MFDKKTLRVWLILVVGILSAPITLTSASAAGPNGITKPLDGATVSGSVYVDGIADDPNFGAWQLDLLPGGDEKQAILLAQSATPNRIVDTFERLDTTAYSNGAYRLRLRVIKNDGNYDQYFISITINNTALATKNGITSPLDGATVNCIVPIKGIADDPNFGKWQLDLLAGGDPNQVVFLDHGFSPNKTGRTFTQLDTTAFPNGTHRLRLRVVRRDANYDESFIWITINNLAPITIPCQSPVSSSNTDSPVGPNGITNPIDGATVSGTVPVTGLADDPNFAAWQVDLLFGGDENQAVLMAWGKVRNRTGSAFTQLDTSALPDGKYGLRLSISRKDTTSERHTIYITVANSTLAKVQANGCVKVPSERLHLPRMLLVLTLRMVQSVLPVFCDIQ